MAKGGNISNEWFAIVNPAAGNGRGLADWPYISKLLRNRGIIPGYAFTERKYHAVELTVSAIAQGYRKIIVIGGEGTLHEVVNGLFIQQLTPADNVLIAIIPTGHSNEWVGGMGAAEKYPEAIDAIASGYFISRNVGKVSFHKANYKQTRYMASTAGIGLDAYITRKYEHKRDGEKSGRLLYLWTAFKCILRFRPTGVKMWVDGELAVNNFSYGARISIRGRNDCDDSDGFIVTVIRRLSKLRVIKRMRSMNKGQQYDMEQLSVFRGRSIKIESSPEVGLALDGEHLGYTPIEFEVVDPGINLIIPKPAGQAKPHKARKRGK